MAKITKYVVQIALLLAISDITEAGRSRASSRSGSRRTGNSRRRQQTSQKSEPVVVNPPPPFLQRHLDSPPAYSPHNVPGGVHTNINERPPMYSPSGSNAAYSGHQGPPTGHPSHQGLTPGYTIHQGRPASYQQSAGGIRRPSTVHRHHYNGTASKPQPGGYIPVAGVQPGFYPAGSIPQQSQSSGLGFGTGLIAGGLGGALLGHALTPSRSGDGSSNNNNDHDRVIIINNTPGAPATVGAPRAVAPGGPIAPGSTYTAAEAPVLLAPFPSQPNAAGAPMQPQMSTDPAAMPPMQNSGIPPMPPNNSSEPPPAADQVQYGVMCVPIYVNVSDPVNPENVTLVEQIYCYNATMPAAENTTSSIGPNMMADQRNMQSPMTSQNQKQQSKLQNTPPATQKPSNASLTDKTIVKSGSFGIHETTSIFGLLISTTIASFLIN